jgi:hypothetical protein
MTARKISSLVQQALTSMQEVMGDHGLNAVLKSCGLERFVGNFPPNDLEPSIRASQYAQLNQAIEDFYGRGGKGMLRRIGKASFQYGVREQAALLGVAGVALKLLPERQRIKFILNGMADALKKSNPQWRRGWMKAAQAQYVESCAICNGPTATIPFVIFTLVPYPKRCSGQPARSMRSSKHTALQKAINIADLKLGM